MYGIQAMFDFIGGGGGRRGGGGGGGGTCPQCFPYIMTCAKKLIKAAAFVCSFEV